MYRLTWCRTVSYRALTSASECACIRLQEEKDVKHSLQMLQYTSTAYKFCITQAHAIVFESPASRRAFFPSSELGKIRDEKSIMRRFDSCLILSEAYST